MLRSLVDEVVRRRLWPVLLAAVLVAIVAPLLFMKSAPSNAPSVSEVPAAAKAGALPTPAARLVTTSDKAVVGHHAKSKRHDPFAPPSSAVAAAKAAAATQGGGATTAAKPAAKAKTTTSKAASAKTTPVPVVITNGQTTKTSEPSSTTPNTTKASSAITSNGSKSKESVDVRFDEHSGAKVHHNVAQLKTFKVDGQIVAVFLKWSPTRDKAVFAIDPSTIVTGPVQCRRKDGVCRYVDIPVGSYARLTWLGSDGSFVTRRLDLVKYNHG